ncbi:MAG TPA: pentapeptide repeat-containing protein, partial [Methanothrix sp.]|nr:pentapeptide repeat-containing protein [Methanothrix sp.]
MANPEQLSALRQGPEAWNRWRAANPQMRADFRGADLSGMDLSGADLQGANLMGAALRGTGLAGVD